MSIHPSHVSWPYKELHPRPQAVPTACVPAAYSCTPLARFVAPQGASPKASAAPSARVPAIHYGTAVKRLVPAWGAPPKAPAAFMRSPI
eukprot:702107-Pyramimonas_sp.AAC.1